MVRRGFAERTTAVLGLLVLVASVLSVTGVAMGSSPGCPNRSLPGFRVYLPECRAYEMVTPPYKEGFSVPAPAALAVSDDGSQVLVESSGSFLTPEGTEPEGTGLFGHAYRLVRTEASWEAVPVDAPFSKHPDIGVLSMSSDFGSSLWFATVPGRSVADVYLDPSAGSLPYVEPAYVGPGAPLGVAQRALDFMGASEELSHALFIVRSPNVGLEEDQLWPGDTTFSERRHSLYEYAGTGNSEPRLVGVSNVGVPANVGAGKLISNCGTQLGSIPEGEAYNALSASGETVFFTAAECGGSPPVNELYARVDQKKTVAISEPALPLPGRECTGACSTAENTPGDRKPGIFAGASLDGSKVFFMTQQSLVNDDEKGEGSGMDLYEAEIAGEGEHASVVRLVQVSRGGEGDSTPGSGAEVLGVARISENGSHVYFVARGVLTGKNGEGDAPSPHAPNLYVFSTECPGGETTCGSPVERTLFVATLSVATLSSPGDERDWSLEDARPVQTTPEGRFLVFQSTGDLTPDQEERQEAGQVFEYDAETETLVRVSRGQEGYDEDGNSSVYPATIPIQNEETDDPTTRFTGLAVSEDGSRVFFSSSDALTPQALGGVANVYEYHDGQVALISDGHDVLTESGHTTTMLIGTDESGSDVFFTTADRLVSQDTDTEVDIYDARIDGGFVLPSEPAPCSPGACRAPASEPLSLLAPASTSVSAETASTPVGSRSAPKHKTAGKKTKKHKRTASRHKLRKAKRAKAGRR